MKFTTEYNDAKVEITDLFKATFTASEGDEEGALIGSLVDRMFASTDAADIFVFSALNANERVGAAVFTRVHYPQDGRTVFILSPMAVATARQGTGIGQSLLIFALNALKESGVDVVLTYGDVRFYSKVGFRQLSETDAKPPLPLTYPEGWLGQSLADGNLDPLKGPSTCVDALNQQELW